MKILIVIPTYNESANIVKLIKNIILIDKSFHILIIDDNSPDGTGRLVDQIAQKYKQVRIIHREGKLGLGSAYVTGFKYALKNKYDLVFEMDADFSHQPKYLNKFIIASQKYDLVLGSRWIKGGGVIGWSWYRYLTSLTANFVTRVLLKLKPKDITSGYRCYQVKTLKKINLSNIVSSGYAFQEEMIYQVQKNNFLIGEIPIIFMDRQKGQSKMGFKEILNSSKAIILLLIKNRQNN